MSKIELSIPADIENLNRVIEFVCNRTGFLGKENTLLVKMATEEIFVNIASYAYKDGEGMATVTIECFGTPDPRVILEFIDSGIPYNPLETPDPDTALAAGERAIGGLGVFMVKQKMDEMTYRYEGNKNILTVVKRL